MIYNLCHQDSTVHMHSERLVKIKLFGDLNLHLGFAFISHRFVDSNPISVVLAWLLFSSYSPVMLNLALLYQKATIR